MILYGLNVPVAEIIAIMHVLTIALLFWVLKKH
jgi:uncharacterized membrane protein YwzB